MSASRLPFRLTPPRKPDWRHPLPPLQSVPTPRQLHIPVVAPAASNIQIIAPGTLVTPGQSLLAADSPALAVSPVDARVVELTEVTLTSARRVPAITLDILPEQSPVAPSTPPPAQLPLWIDLFRRSGIWADRATCPDLLTQLTQLASRPVDTIICNLLDHEPPLALNALLAQQHAPILVAALVLLMQLTSAQRAIFVIDEASPASLRQPLAQAAQPAKLLIADLPAHYPQSLPPLLLRDVLDRNLRPGRSPLERATLLLDGPAAFAIGSCVLHQQPMLHVPVALHDHLQRQSHYLLAPIGMRIQDLLRHLSINPEGIGLHAGDLLRQIHIPPDAVIAPAELLLHVMPLRAAAATAPCVRCNSCADHCPMALQPAILLEAAQEDDAILAAQAGIDACIQCGICDHVCPSQLPLMASIRKLRPT